MKEYVLITVVKSSNWNAGPKAPQDILNILEKTGKVESILLESQEHMDYPLFLHLLQELKRIRSEDRKVILQYPLQPFFFFEQQELFKTAYSFLNPAKTIVWVHDINQIRFSQRLECQEEMKWLKPFRYFIVHNAEMERFLREYIPMGQYIQNEIFDYISAEENKWEIRKSTKNKELQIVFAGNLDRAKGHFLYEMEKEKMHFRLDVYGKRDELIRNEKICYRGNFHADILSGHLCGDLGLIWDGALDSADIDTYKNYTRYNVPHKFSCYMAAGLPVIAWREAAIAEVIRKYQVGYLIDNLYEINNLDLALYETYQENAQSLGQKVRSGYFTRQVFAQIERRWNAL